MTRNRILLLPITGAVVAGCLLATFMSLVALLGGAAAQSGCQPAAGFSVRPAGGPAALRPLFVAAADRYHLGPNGPAILAGLTSVESGFGQNMGPSSAGAVGWTQFLPSTWARWGVDANHDGRADPYTASDAIFSTARYLAAAGAPADWHRALYAYNHSDAYVTTVLDRARQLAATPDALSEPAAAPGTTVVVGDSLEVGTLPLLRKRLGGTVIGDAQSGRTSSAGVEVLRRLLQRGDATTIVFDLGTNDPSIAALRRSLRQLDVLAAGRRVVLATVNSPYDEHAKNALVRRYAAAHPDVMLVPWHEASRRLRLPDGIHGGYPTRARLLARAITDVVPTSPACSSAPITGAALSHDAGPASLVAVPGQPGMRVDARILPDVVYLIRTYHLTVTAAYAASGHAANGEHPLGLAIDLVPGPGGSWDDVDRLARWAESIQNHPRRPFRWVGYTGDPGHGRGNHLHLSWNHAPDPARRPPAAWVDTFAVPDAIA